MSSAKAIDAIAPVLAAFKRLEVRCFVGGSLVSSAYGVARSTADADLIAELELSHVSQFVDALQQDYYVSQPMIESAIRHKSSFNVIHYPTMFKVDIFVAKDTPFARSEIARVRVERIGTEDTGIMAPVASPEDTILNKLYWFRLGNEISQRQWQDVQGVLKVQAANLDIAYLTNWAQELNIGDLLERALGEAGIGK